MDCSPPELFNSLNAALHCKDQAAISEMVEQEQWGAEGVQPPLNRSHYIRYNFNAGCSAGSAPFFVIRRITPYLFKRHTRAPWGTQCRASATSKFLGSTLCCYFLLGGHPETRVQAAASSLFCPFAIAPI